MNQKEALKRVMALVEHEDRKEVLFLLKRCRKHLVKQWGEDDGFIQRLDTAIAQMEGK